MATAEEIVKPSRVTKHTNVFTIGPYGRPVSFAYQQRRALSLVWALETIGKIAPDKSVAVIGAGLAGLTAATALAARQCRVALYEKLAKPLFFQRKAHHRLLHPTVNFWPFTEHASTTRFPFFDWHVGMCAPTIKLLRETWTSTYMSALNARYFFTDVEKIEEDSRGRVVVHSVGRHSEPETLSRAITREEFVYDLVIIATGFGRERDLDDADADTYWDIDNFEDYLNDASLSQFVVSGTGDGGLIDSLRLLHRDFRDGQLPLRIIGYLRNEVALVNEMKKLEGEARLDDDPEAAPPDLAAIVEKLQKGYHELARLMPSAVKSVLLSSLEKGRLVTLVGTNSAPFQMDAAPIHKLLIANAQLEQRLTYRRGKVVQRLPKTIILDTLKKTLLFRNPKLVECAADVYIARHGAPPPLCAIIPNLDEERVRLRQLWLSDRMDQAAWPIEYFNRATPGNCEDSPESKQFIEARTSIVNSYLTTFYNHPPPEVRAQGNGKYAYVLSPSKINDEVLAAFGGRETQLFGTPVIYQESNVVGVPATLLVRN